MPSAYHILEKASEIEYLLLENQSADEPMELEERIILETELSDLYLEIEKKVENIDGFTLALDQNKAVVQAKLDIINDEAKRLRKKREGMDKTKEYFYGQILPRIINQFGDGESYKTDVSTYKFAKKFSKVIVEDLGKVDAGFIRHPAPVIDGNKARKAAIKAYKSGTKEGGFYVYEEQIVKRS